VKRLGRLKRVKEMWYRNERSETWKRIGGGAVAMRGLTAADGFIGIIK
jgi:hypothetical protein